MMNRLTAAEERTPVIVGIGEVTDRVRDPQLGREPLELMRIALTRAGQDAVPGHGQGLVSEIDSLDIVAEFSWPYDNPTELFTDQIGARPTRAVYGETGGETPLRYINQAAVRIAEGESELAAIVGAEATYSVALAQKRGVDLPWRPCASGVEPHNPASSIARRYGASLPPYVYPFYENATQASWGQTQRAGLLESGELWSGMSRVASKNPGAWLRYQYEPEEITTPSEGNRLVAWPYTKLMVANPMVNQGAAVLITSAAYADRLGIPSDRMIYVQAGAAASDEEDFLQRDQYCRSHAQEVVLERALELAGGSADAFDLIELYSCFPCVPKMARRHLGVPADRELTVAGGLSFFGAPLNNYMTHATAAAVGKLRGIKSGTALLYGQGGYVTKHHVLILSSAPSRAGNTELRDLTAAAEQRRGFAPPLVESYEGSATLETFTVVYQRSGEPDHGIAIALTPQGQRVIAEVPPDDLRTSTALTDLDTNPIGSGGTVSRVEGERLQWTIN